MENFRKVIIRLQSILSNPSVLLIVWLLLLSMPFLDLLRYYLLGQQRATMDKLGGFIGWGEILSIAVLFLLFLITIFIWYKTLFVSRRILKIHFTVLLIVSVTALIYSLGIKFLQGLQILKYANYLYSRFGIRPTVLEIMLFICIVAFCMCVLFLLEAFRLYIFGSPVRSVSGKIQVDRKKDLLEWPVLVALVPLLLLIGQTVYPFSSIPVLVKEVGQGYEKRLGKGFVYLNALLGASPDKSFIILPPQSIEWPLVGNQPMARYFLFPRTLVSGALYDDGRAINNISEAYFVEIPQSASIPAWPSIDMDQKLIKFGFKSTVGFEEIIFVEETSGAKVYKILLR